MFYILIKTVPATGLIKCHLHGQCKPGRNAASSTVPSHWSIMPPDKQYERVPLSAVTPEYKDVHNLGR